MSSAIRPIVAPALFLFVLLGACSRPDPAAGPSPAAAPAAAAGGAASRPRSAAVACPDAGLGPEPDAAGLRAFVRRRSAQAQARDCYQRALKRDPGVGGKATLRFTIGPCGDLSRVDVVARSGRVDEAAGCVARAMRSWRTPFRPSEPVEVEYPFAFSASM